MGLIGWVVVIILGLLSVIASSMMLKKAVLFHKARAESTAFIPLFDVALKKNDLQQAADIARKYKKSHLAQIMLAGVTEYQNERDELRGDELVAAIDRAVSNETELMHAKMHHGLNHLATIASTSPFVGLFGTVMGIIHAFQGIAHSGSGGLSSVSAGIAEALITTAIGILVAVMALAWFNHYTSRLNRFQVEMNTTAKQMVGFFKKKIAKDSRPEAA